ncbi:MAG: hypothetical protein LUH10_15155 [Tannerellaceae bacterium]|nr:hypothetical protein [Tannerellaceae bacterium]
MNQKFFLGAILFSLLFSSCSKEETPYYPDAIRTGNFLEAANFKDLSKLNIQHSDEFVEESFQDGIASFKYSKPTMRSSSEYYEPQVTEISLNEDLIVEFTPGVYELEFEYYFDLDTDEQIQNAIQNISMKLKMEDLSHKYDNDPMLIFLGSGGDESMVRTWSTYKTKFEEYESSYRAINLNITNISKMNNNTLHLRNISLTQISNVAPDNGGDDPDISGNPNQGDGGSNDGDGDGKDDPEISM